MCGVHHIGSIIDVRGATFDDPIIFLIMSASPKC
jgi:hypothetical protein